MTISNVMGVKREQKALYMHDIMYIQANTFNQITKKNNEETETRIGK